MGITKDSAGSSLQSHTIWAYPQWISIDNENVPYKYNMGMITCEGYRQEHFVERNRSVKLI